MGNHPKQRGIVLIIVLIVLTAMMFAGIALMRSVDTSTLVAGNMAFRQAAVHQADYGTEAAIVWLQANNSGTTLETSASASGYFAVIQGPSISTTSASSDQTWDAYWNGTLDPTPATRPVTTAVNSGNVWTLPTTSQGYTVSYVIHRMCPTVSTEAGCVQSPTGAAVGSNSQKAGNPANFTENTQIYYRITSRVDGPHNTVVYSQAVVAM
jgi:type IV pilus assembly protein PilX